MQDTGEKQRTQFNRWLPCIGTACALVAQLPMALWGDSANSFVWSALVLLPASLLIFAITLFNLRRQALAACSMLLLYTLVSWCIWKTSDDLRSEARWFRYSREYKAKLLSQARASGTELDHMEWDSWGWGGTFTIVYLVYDPTDSLASMTRGKSLEKLPGIPCEVRAVRKLERHWYSVTFYSDQEWEACKQDRGK